MQNSKFARTTLAVTIVLLVSKFTGFLRDVALAYAFGTSAESDAFVLVQSVLSIFSYLLFIVLGIAFIPVFSKLKLDGGDSELNSFVDSTYSMAGTVILLACVLGFLGSDILVYLLAPGFSEAHHLGVILTRILMPAVFFIFLSTIQGQQLRGSNIFMPSAFLAYPLNLALIFAFLFLALLWGIQSAAFAYAAGTILQVLMLHPFVKKLGYRFHCHFDPGNSGLRKILILTLPSQRSDISCPMVLFHRLGWICPQRYHHQSLPAALLFAVFSGILIYSALILCLKVKEADYLTERLKGRREK